ncbi:unnamed protein product [Caenorhabditis sp. 36 PRJEB53466]|nr:unnamed protein product [Caenorhabditis sp. 36 PRJEB53466]
MEGDLTKTPYNSIYATLKNKKPEGDVMCCVHGSQCTYGRSKPGVKPDNNQYVNLASPKMEASQLAEKLSKLTTEDGGASSKPELISLNSLMANNGGDQRKSKSGRDKRKKKTPAIVDDNQSYVMLGPSTDESSAHRAPIPPPPPTEVISKQKSFKLGQVASAYIGVSTLTDAENRLTRRGEFALYHLFNSNSRLDTLSDDLALMLVYRTTTKKIRHYSIRMTADEQFFVDCGYPNVRKHFSLDQLVMYYKTSATCEINPDDTSADSFSWWLE